MTRAKHYKTVTKFVKVMSRILWPLFSQTRCIMQSIIKDYITGIYCLDLSVTSWQLGRGIMLTACMKRTAFYTIDAGLEHDIDVVSLIDKNLMSTPRGVVPPTS